MLNSSCLMIPKKNKRLRLLNPFSNNTGPIKINYTASSLAVIKTHGWIFQTLSPTNRNSEIICPFRPYQYKWSIKETWTGSTAVKRNQINVLAVSETHLSNIVSDTELTISGYSFVRKDRSGWKITGVECWSTTKVTFHHMKLSLALTLESQRPSG